METWKFLKPVDREKINHAGLVIHHAAQFPAMAGKYLVAQKPDDSNTNMEWIPERNIFAGNLIGNRLKAGLDPLQLHLLILDKDHKTLHHLPLEKYTGKEVFEWMKEKLASHGLDVIALKDVMHYEIPPLKMNEDRPFKADSGLLYEWVKYRTVSNLVISTFSGYFNTASAVRVWPHHFDTGSTIPLEFDNKQEAAKSIGLGFAVADTYVAEPYFYINNQQKDGLPDYSVLPELGGNGTWNKKDWVGAVLPLSAITSRSTGEDQQALVYSFFNSGINQTLKLLGISKSIST